MYLEYFGLREFPFSLTPDTQFFFEYGHYLELASARLVYAKSKSFGEGLHAGP